jgi:hypothetical protein
MAVGDIVADLQAIDSDSVLTIQPGAGAEWIIHNIYHEDAVELYIAEDSNAILFDSHLTRGSWGAYFFHLTNDHYLKVKNKAALAKLVAYDGVVSK